MLSCKDVNKNSDQYIDQELSLRQRINIKMHLLMCVHCRRYLKQMAATVNSLRTLPQDDCSDQQTEALLDRLLDDAGDEKIHQAAEKDPTIDR